MPFAASDHRALLESVTQGPIKFVVVTHSHLDPSGGVNHSEVFWLRDQITRTREALGG